MDSVAVSLQESPGLAVRQQPPGASWARARCAQRVWGLPEPERSSKFMEGGISLDTNEAQSH